MIKKTLVFAVVCVFLLTGCEQLKELYGIEPSGEGEYVPIEKIKIEGEIEEEEVAEIIEEIGEEVPEIIEEIEEIEEVVERREEAKVIIVKETDLVSLKPKAVDPDKDTLDFSYTTPLDKEGKWQTTYGDEGEYAITITASDGDLSVTKNVLVIVNKKEEAPVIEQAVPEKEALEAKENSKLEFSIKASDLNKDPLTYSWKLDNEETSAKESYTYDIDYDGAGQHTVNVVVSDGVEEASKTWSIKVENVNRLPILEKIADVKLKETETIILKPEAGDPDKDELKFSIDSDKFKKTDTGFEWKTTYDDSGEYIVIVTVSDGEDEASQEIGIIVENVNRPPVIEDIILG